MGGDGGEPPASFKECEAPMADPCMAETSISKQESEMIYTMKSSFRKKVFFFKIRRVYL